MRLLAGPETLVMVSLSLGFLISDNLGKTDTSAMGALFVLNLNIRFLKNENLPDAFVSELWYFYHLYC
jgi:hypothetical protein